MWVIYIAGPMRGLIDMGRDNFRQAEAFLKGRFGWKVLNPACLPLDMPAERYMPICLAMIQQADAVGMLPGWEESQGATLEKRFAESIGKRIIILEKDYGFEYRTDAESDCYIPF